MKKRGSTLLLISGCLLVCDLQVVRQFRYVNLLKTWSDAQTYCRATFSDLATIQSAANNTEAQQLAGTSKFWIGLFDGSWKWSQEESQGSSFSTWYTNWNTNEPQTGDCVVISKDGFWSAKDCGAQYQFFCYNALINLHILVTQTKTWSDAQVYCRSTYKDLSSIKNLIDNGVVSALLPVSSGSLLGLLPSVDGSSQLAWIGLHRSMWVWSDGSTSSYRVWGSLQANVRADCVMMDSSLGTWFWRPCSELYPSLCYTNVSPLDVSSGSDPAGIRTSVMRLVKMRLSPGSADLTDPAVQESILQQLKQMLQERGITEEVKLRWRKQEDGSVFQRQDETAPPAV